MIHGIRISSAKMAVQKDGTALPAIAALKNNQEVSARVLKFFPGGKALLQVAGQTVTARTGLLLTPGEELQLTVTKKSDEIILKLATPDPKISSRQTPSLRGLFSASKSDLTIPQSPNSPLDSLLHELAVKSEKPDHSFLPRLIEKGGLLFENKMTQLLQQPMAGENIKDVVNQLLHQDLKGAVFSEQMNLNNEPDIVKTIGTFLETLETFQHLNHQSAESGRYLLPIPILSESAFRFGQLLIDTGQAHDLKKEDKDKLYSISFLLDMTNLGPMRADFSILKKAITGKFLLSDADTCDYVRSQVPILKKRLADMDFQVQKIDCMTATPEKIKANALVETLVKAQDQNVLNIVV